MAIIGQSKNKGLYEKVTEEGSKYRDLKYADLGYSSMWDGQPILHGYIPEKPGQMLGSDAVSLLRAEGIPPVTQGRTDVDLKSNVLLPVTARIDDTERITRLLTKVPGIKWEAHNAELGAIQSNLERKRSKYTAGSPGEGTGIWNVLAQIGQNLVQGLLDVTKTTLAQVAVAGTGEHFSSWILAGKSYLGKSAAEYALASELVPVNPRELGYFQLPDRDNQAIEDARKPKRTEEGNSTNATRFGLIETTVKKISESLLGKENFNITSGSFQSLLVTSSLLSSSLADESRSLQEAREPRSTREGGVPDLDGKKAKGTDLGVNELSPESQSYVAQHSSQLINSYFASGSRSYDSGSVSGPWKHDGAHALRAGTAGSGNPNHAQDGGQSSYEGRENMPTGDNVHTRVDNGRIDMIPFWIRAISPDGTVKDNAYLFFEANLDSYSDNYDATWESTQYLGRADKFWTYSGFDRQISFSFKMVAHTKSHLKPIYNRLNGLLSMTTPSYGEGGTFMQGVLAEVTIGDLLSRQLGFIKSVGLKWETDYMWEIDGNTAIRVPHILDVSVGFTPIHQFIPRLRRRYFNLAGDGLTEEMVNAGNTFGLFTANVQGKNGYNLYN